MTSRNAARVAFYAALPIALATIGCAAPRTLDGNALILDRTTKSALVAMIGEPQSSTTAAESGAKYESLAYHVGSGSIYVTDAPMGVLRTGLFEFGDATLKAYLLVGPLREDRTRFTVATSDTIQSGTTTKDDLVKRFGPPLGQARNGARLFAPERGWKPDVARTVVWADVSNGRNGFLRHEMYLRLLLVDLNAADRVIRTRTFESKQLVSN